MTDLFILRQLFTPEINFNDIFPLFSKGGAEGKKSRWMGTDSSQGEEDCHTDSAGGGASQEQVFEKPSYELLFGWNQVAAGYFWPCIW